MKQSSILAAASTAFILLGVLAPVSAAVPVWGGAKVLEDGGMVHNVGHWVTKCKTVRVKTAYGWKKVKKCKKVWPKHVSGSY
jgi:hypothetical protein